MYQICMLRFPICTPRGVEDKLLSCFFFSCFFICSQGPDAFNIGGADHHGEDAQLLCD